MNIQTFLPGEYSRNLINLLREKTSYDLEGMNLASIFKNKKIIGVLKKNEEESVTLGEIEYEELFKIALEEIGYQKGASNYNLCFEKLYQKYGYNFNEEQSQILASFIDCIKKQLDAQKRKIEFNSFIDDVLKKYGFQHIEFSIDIIESFSFFLNSDPFYRVNKYGCDDVIKINDLFILKRNNSSLGKWFDQRYIDFLEKNNTFLDTINWRKFEQLTAQYFENLGYNVIKLGRGTKDGGVDVIVFDNEGYKIVQSKRWKSNVPEDVVKVLDSTMMHEKIDNQQYCKGIIFCTHDASGPAKKYINKNNLKIEIIGRNEILSFLKKYRSY